jgi:hypothetical protein
MKRTLESGIQAAICDYLAMRRVFFFRCNNQPIFDPKRGIFRSLPKHTPKGLSDIIAVKNGKAYFIEVKREDGKLSAEQIEFGKDVILAGAEYVVARSIEDVQRLGL